MLADWWNSEGRWLDRTEARAVLLSLAKVAHPDKALSGWQADHPEARRILSREANAYTTDIVALLAHVREP